MLQSTKKGWMQHIGQTCFAAILTEMVSREAQFWLAAALYRLERYDDAENIVSDLIRRSFHYPNLRKLAELIRERRQVTRKPVVTLLQ